jgi:hypothetical protein
MTGETLLAQLAWQFFTWSFLKNPIPLRWYVTDAPEPVFLIVQKPKHEFGNHVRLAQWAFLSAKGTFCRRELEWR